MAGKTVQQGACILIIEDDPNMQQQLSQWLTTRNYKLITATDQKQGKDALEKNDVDLVLMDVQLPDGDDMYFCSDLDAIESVPIIIITGAHVQDDDEIAGFNALAHDYIRKPITNPKVLLARVEAALRNNKTKLLNNTIASGRFELDLKRSVLKTDTGQWPLTPSECKLMEILMINPDGVLEHVKLQEHLHDMDSDATDNAAIHTCIHRLKQKILGGSNGPWPIDATVLIHDPILTDASGPALSVEALTIRLMNIRKQIAEILSKHTGAHVDEILKLTARDSYFNAEEAIRFGLADYVIREWGEDFEAG